MAVGRRALSLHGRGAPRVAKGMLTQQQGRVSVGEGLRHRGDRAGRRGAGSFWIQEQQLG